MRSPAPLVVLVALSACAAYGSTESEWRLIQRERLQRLYEPRDPEAVVKTMLGRPPRSAWTPQEPGRQDPVHLDQREPRRADAGPRPFTTAQPPITVAAAVGAGNVSVRVAGTSMNDRADAAFAKLSVESATGAALHAEIWSSDDGLLSGLRINDGVDPVKADANLQGLLLFPHVRLEAWRDGELCLPVRVGLFTDWQEMDHDLARVERRWLSLGPKVVLEPTWRALGGRASSLDLYGRIGGEVGPAWFTEEYRGGDSRDATARWTGEIGAGLHAELGRWQADLGYQLHHTTFGEIDSDLYGSHGRTELQRQQVFLGFGVRL